MLQQVLLLHFGPPAKRATPTPSSPSSWPSETSWATPRALTAASTTSSLSLKQKHVMFTARIWRVVSSSPSRFFSLSPHLHWATWRRKRWWLPWMWMMVGVLCRRRWERDSKAFGVRDFYQIGFRVFFSIKQIYHRWVKNAIQGASQTLTRGSQHHCLTVNVQLRRPGPTL